MIAAHPGGLRALDLVLQFQRCNTLPVERHGRSRRNDELKVLAEFFSESGNPYINCLPSQRQFESWVIRQDAVRNFDSVRLFRMIWGFFTKHGYIDSECPWKSIGQHRERVTLELADILYPYSLSPLKEILGALLTSNSEISHAIVSDDKAARAMIWDALGTSKQAARIALAESFRNDLIPALLDLSYETLFEVLLSSTRIKNLPPGKIILREQKRTVIASLRQKVTTDE